MSQVPTHPDVVVIGAGAAGIGAGLELLRHGVSFVIIEAKHRVGGRAYSETSSLGHLWDHGCHWLHSASLNVLRDVAIRLGHRFRMPEGEATYNAFINGRWVKSGWDDAHAWNELEAIARRGATEDIAASQVLDQAHEQYPLARNWCQLMFSQDPEFISTRDASNYTDTYENFPVEDGLGALIARMAEGLPVRLNTAAREIDLSGPDVRVETSAGTIRCKAAILAVPARMVERERIRISPRLPDSVRAAFEDVPMGYYEKVAFAFDKPVLDPSMGPFADISDAKILGPQPCNAEVHPFGRPIAVSHFGGAWVADARPGELIDLAEAALIHAFGSELRRHITRRAITEWTGDPFINGAYSCTRPGRAASRTEFQAPVHEKLFMCGEHTHRHFQATAHGAYETGLVAARQAARLLAVPLLPEEPGWTA